MRFGNARGTGGVGWTRRHVTTTVNDVLFFFVIDMVLTEEVFITRTLGNSNDRGTSRLCSCGLSIASV